jgi:hypothetical protein
VAHFGLLEKEAKRFIFCFTLFALSGSSSEDEKGGETLRDGGEGDHLLKSPLKQMVQERQRPHLSPDSRQLTLEQVVA